MSLRAALRELPQRDPPEAVWGSIQARLDAPEKAAPSGRPHRGRTLALAASVVICAVAIVLLAYRFDRGTGQFTAENSGARPAEPAPGYRATLPQPDGVAELVAESARLEAALTALPRYRGVVRVGSAGTIVELEDHIVWIDAELSAGEALGADPNYRHALWQDRVDLMNALIDVQFAQLPERVLLQ